MDNWVAVESDVSGKSGISIAPASSAFQFFQRKNAQLIAAELRRKGEPSDVGSLTKVVSSKFRELSHEEREFYEELAAEDKCRYAEECARRDREVMMEQEQRRKEREVEILDTRMRNRPLSEVEPSVKKEPRELTEKDKEKKRLRDEQKRASAQAKAATEAEIQRQQDTVKGDVAKQTSARLKYLLSQSDIFKHFGKIGSSGDLQQDATADANHPAHLGKRKEESEEDQEMLKEDITEEPGVFLTQQPSCIKNGKLRQYQVEGLNWLIRLQENGINGILADEMGLGKTLQSIAILGYLLEFKGISGPHLILVPKSTLSNWINEFKRWCPSLRAVKLHGSREERAEIIDTVLCPGAREDEREWDALVTTYECANMEKGTLQKFAWRYLIIDEAHRLKNEQSMFSQTVRTFSVQHRLLITGTPLQNNLHELWALLNFLLPDVFASSDQFDQWFNLDIDDNEAKRTIITQLHKVLRPFMLRRLKADVEGNLPPKTETILFTGMSAMQKNLYRQILLRDIDVVNGSGGAGGRTAVLNIVMQLRKSCNHPYLFAGVEDRTLDPLGEHLVQNCGKMVLLDKLLRALEARGHRVLIFSQMTRMLDIFEDYMVMRGWQYCRIDGNTSYDMREEYIDAYNAPNSPKFAFLLSTRAGGLGINLQTADTVILYDSDWNPQADLQAQDRAHRIGQKRPVNVYRLVTEGSIEEKVVERAQQKLKLDAMVVQQGRLQDKDRKVTKDDLLTAVRFGADQVFRSKESTITDDDIDAILERGKNKTKELQDKLEESNKGDMLDFRLDGGFRSQEFEGVNYADKSTRNQILGVIDIGKRERKRVVQYQNSEFAQELRRNPFPQPMKKRSKLPKIFRLPRMEDWQWFDKTRLEALQDLEEQKFMELKAEGLSSDELNMLTQLLSDELHQEKTRLLAEGFPNWMRQHYNVFCRASAKFGRNDYQQIAAELEKPVNEVEAYAKAFWEKGPLAVDEKEWERVVRNVEKGEKKIEEVNRLMTAAKKLISRFRDPWEDLIFQYVGTQGRVYNIHEDRFLLCACDKYGYGNWDQIRLAIRRSDHFRFDYFLQSCPTDVLGRRCEHLLRLAEKECAEWEKRYQQADAGMQGGDSASGTSLLSIGASKGTGDSHARLAELQSKIEQDARVLAETRLDQQKAAAADPESNAPMSGPAALRCIKPEYRNRKPVPNEAVPDLCRLVLQGHTNLEHVVSIFHTQYPNISKRQIELKIQEISYKGVGTDGNTRGEWILRPEFEQIAKEGASDAGSKRKLEDSLQSGSAPIQKKAKKPSGVLPPAAIIPRAAVISGPAASAGHSDNADQDDDAAPLPRTAFEIFCDDNKEKAKHKCQSNEPATIRDTLKRMWAKLPTDDAEYYQTEAENEEARYRMSSERSTASAVDPENYSIPKKKAGYSIPKRKAGQETYSIPKKKHSF